MRLDNLENCFKFSESRTLPTLKVAKQATDRVIIQFDPISSKGIIASIAKDNCTRSKLGVNPISVKGLDISKPGARFSKLPLITGPVKVFCFPFQMRVSEGLKTVL